MDEEAVGDEQGLHEKKSCRTGLKTNKDILYSG